MKKLIFIVLVIALAGGGGWYWHTQKAKAAGAGETNIADVTTGNLESVVTAQGTLEPKDYVDVGAQVSGLVETLHVEIGDAVKKDDLIAEIDPDVYESEVRASEAELKTLGAQKAEQEALVKQAAQKLKRNQTLIADHAISKEALEAGGQQDQFELHQDLRADGWHGRVAIGERGPDNQRQPDGARHCPDRQSVDHDGEGAGGGGGYFAPLCRYADVFHGAGVQGQKMEGHYPPDFAVAGNGERCRAL